MIKSPRHSFSSSCFVCSVTPFTGSCGTCRGATGGMCRHVLAPKNFLSCQRSWRCDVDCGADGCGVCLLHKIGLLWNHEGLGLQSTLTATVRHATHTTALRAAEQHTMSQRSLRHKLKNLKEINSHDACEGVNVVAGPSLKRPVAAAHLHRRLSSSRDVKGRSKKKCQCAASMKRGDGGGGHLVERLLHLRRVHTSCTRG